MSERFKWALILGISAALLAALMQGPQWLHSRHSLYKGIAVNLNADEAVYLARVQESLSGRPELSAEAFTGHPNLVGSQVAFLEKWYGQLFALTGWRAATVLNVLDSLIPAVLFLLLFWFFRLSGLPRWYAFGGAVAFSLLQLYNLNRPIHMRSSFLLMLLCLIGVSAAVRSRWWGIALGGVLLGTLVGVYFWSFSFAWAFWGVYLLWELLEWGYGHWKEHQKLAHSRIRRMARTAWGVFWHFRPRKPSFQFLPWHLLAITGLLGILFALPAIAHFIAMMHHPLYEFASFRSGMHPGRLPESIPYSVLFFAMCVSVGVALYHHYAFLRPYRVILVMVFTVCIYIHQNVVHGITFNFVSHGIFSMATASIGLIALAIHLRSRYLTLGALAACVYLAAIGYDGRYLLSQWTVQEGRFNNQHLSEVLPIFDELPRGRILSDPDTSSFIAGYTHHDIVYSVYLKNVLMTHSELASRYCLTQIPIPPSARNIAETPHLIFPDASAAFGEEVRAEEVRIVESACREMDLDPALSLETYEIDYVFWNRVWAPNWDIKRIPVFLDTVESGEDWALLKIVR